MWLQTPPWPKYISSSRLSSLLSPKLCNIKLKIMWFKITNLQELKTGLIHPSALSAFMTFFHLGVDEKLHFETAVLWSAGWGNEHLGQRWKPVRGWKRFSERWMTALWCGACLMWPVQTLGWTFPDMSKKSWGAPLWRSRRAPTLKPAPAWSSLSSSDFPLSIKCSVFPCQTKIWTLTTLRVYKLSK